MTRTNHFRVSSVLVALALALVLMALVASPARAATLKVTKTADTFDGVCDSDCSLREAIFRSNANGQSDTINFASGVRGIITLDGYALTIVNDSTNPVTINGPGSGTLAISGNNASRVFQIGSGANVTINGLTIRNGETDLKGAGISNEGVLVLNDSVVRDNRDIDGNEEQEDTGGGIHNVGFLTLNRSTVSDNIGGDGGGIHNEGSGSMEVNQSTISDNFAIFFGGGIKNTGFLELDASTMSSNDAGFDGGGIYSSTRDDEYANINDSTISGNRASAIDEFASGAGGGLYLEGVSRISHSTITNNDNVDSGDIGTGVMTGDSTGVDYTNVTSTIVSGNARNSDVAWKGSAFYSSSGYNLIGGGYTSPFNQTGDQTGITNPLLGPLANNGGPTRTHALLPGSRAIDSAGPSPPAADQRGVARPQDGDANGTLASDIGAFEKEAPRPPAACSDGKDNDRDRKIDFPKDKGCKSPTDNNEKNKKK